jgi:peptidoglycan biosynthesis protein MviN/MurJ (putative lipid II flippase)
MEVSFFFGGDISILFVSSLQTKEEEREREKKKRGEASYYTFSFSSLFLSFVLLLFNCFWIVAEQPTLYRTCARCAFSSAMVSIAH